METELIQELPMETELVGATEGAVEIHVRGKSEHGQGGAVKLTYEMLSLCFHENLDSVASKLGVSKTAIKSACRRLGIQKWPYAHKGPRRRHPRKNRAIEHKEAKKEIESENEDDDEDEDDRSELDASPTPSLTLGLGSYSSISSASTVQAGGNHDSRICEQSKEMPSVHDSQMFCEQSKAMPSVREASHLFPTSTPTVKAGADLDRESDPKWLSEQTKGMLSVQDMLFLIQMSAKKSDPSQASQVRNLLNSEDMAFLWRLSTPFRESIAKPQLS